MTLENLLLGSVRAPSSLNWLEHWTVDHRVAGSNAAGGADLRFPWQPPRGSSCRPAPSDPPSPSFPGPGSASAGRPSSPAASPPAHAAEVDRVTSGGYRGCTRIMGRGRDVCRLLRMRSHPVAGHRATKGVPQSWLGAVHARMRSQPVGNDERYVHPACGHSRMRDHAL